MRNLVEHVLKYTEVRKNAISTRKCKPCQICKEVFTSIKERDVHEKQSHQPIFKCDICNKDFNSKHNLQRHMKMHKPCRTCKKICTSIKERNVHEKRCRQKIRISHFEEDFQTSFKCKTAINNRFKIFTIDPINEIDFQESIRINLETVKRILMEVLRSFSALKFYIVFEADMKKDIVDTSDEFSFSQKL